MKRKQRLYGLFEKQEDGKFVRVYDTLAFPKAQAVKFFQNALLSGALYAGKIKELRPVE